MKASIMIRKAPFAMLVMLALVSCAEGPAGIFSRVASDTPINDGMTAAIKYATPSFVAGLGSSWYAGIGTLWSKKDVSSQWEASKDGIVPDVSADKPVIAGSGAAVPGRLYVAFSEASTGIGLGVWETASGTAWSRTDSAFPAQGETLRRILAANGQLFAVTAKPLDPAEAYSLYYYDGAAFKPTGINASTDIGVPNSLVFYNGAYWFAAGQKLVSGTRDSLTLVDGLGTTSRYGGICSTGSGLIVTDNNGYIHFSSDGSSWTTRNGQLVNASGKVYSLSIPVYIDDGTRKFLVVGTEKKARTSSDTPPVDGYLEFDLTGGFSAEISPNIGHTFVSNATNFDASLSAKSIRAMPLIDLDSDSRKLFALCDGNGLWSTSLDSGTWGGWKRE